MLLLRLGVDPDLGSDLFFFGGFVPYDSETERERETEVGENVQSAFFDCRSVPYRYVLGLVVMMGFSRRNGVTKKTLNNLLSIKVTRRGEDEAQNLGFVCIGRVASPRCPSAQQQCARADCFWGRNAFGDHHVLWHVRMHRGGVVFIALAPCASLICRPVVQIRKQISSKSNYRLIIIYWNVMFRILKNVTTMHEGIPVTTKKNMTNFYEDG